MKRLLLLLLFISVLVACGSAPAPVPTPISTPTATATATPTPIRIVPTATATPSPTPQPFDVTSVSMSVSPASIVNYPCGLTVTVTYRALFQFSGYARGGRVLFEYTVNNGRGSTQASLDVPPGQAQAAFEFTWSGPLPADHTMPSLGGVVVTAPNMLHPMLIQPTGMCIEGA